MALALHPPLAPMEALAVDEIPIGEQWQFEPKWDGFRCLAFRDGASVELQSKSGQPLARYFPEIVEALGSLRAKHFVLDGELAIPRDDALSFEDLLLRVHPAASRVQKLAQSTPALFIVFDLLAKADGRSLVDQPLAERRKELERFAAEYFPPAGAFRLSPQTTDPKAAQRWLAGTGATLDGVIAKRRDLPYRSATRDGMVKIKNYRSADCVVGGFRYGTGKRVVGSLLLGLYDQDQKLQYVGFTSGLSAKERPALTRQLEKLIGPSPFTGRSPGGPSRWSAGKSTEWQPLRPELVVEVSFDHFTGGRFRHGTRLLRWRPDKAPGQCTLAQIAPSQARPDGLF